MSDINKDFNKETSNFIDKGDDGNCYLRSENIKNFYNTKIAKLLKDIVGKDVHLDETEFKNEDDEPRINVWARGYVKKRQETIDKINKSEFKDLI